MEGVDVEVVVETEDADGVVEGAGEDLAPAVLETADRLLVGADGLQPGDVEVVLEAEVAAVP